MNHPIWRCQRCGERLYEHIEGDYQCLNCACRIGESEVDALGPDRASPSTAGL